MNAREEKALRIGAEKTSDGRHGLPDAVID
jgi:hypothetical protein